MGLQQNPAAASIMIKNADEIVNTVSQAMDDIVARIGKPLTKEGASDVIRGAAENAAEVFKTQKKQFIRLFSIKLDLIHLLM